MNWSAPHAGFVLAAYVLSAVVLLALIARTLLTAHRTQRRLQALEAEGAPRRAKADAR